MVWAMARMMLVTGEKGRRRDMVRVKIGRDEEKVKEEKGLVWSLQGPRKEKGR